MTGRTQRVKTNAPLRRERHETFIREYMTGFDGEHAARKAGYSPKVARRIWPILLAAPQITRRMLVIKWGDGVPNIEKDAVLRVLAEDAFTDTSELWATNPFSGERIPVMSRATPNQMRQVAWKTKSTSRGGVNLISEEVVILAGRAHLGIIAKSLGLLAKGGSDREKRGLDADLVERIARARG
ncbi:terminase small subunit [Paragemmobacter straminiformis]|uniref:Terminase small subunit n=1 Tax=Paragemmobacter straminiformis TaxID=2045119 RepID=A0A842I651_9RHOB|nr:terminase small subunit [Gemmobacter straminiformis]MBC2835139.1 terminase small subunit [Gemmobacter straminiformis]